MTKHRKELSMDECMEIFKKYDIKLYEYYSKNAWYFGCNAKNYAQKLLEENETENNNTALQTKLQKVKVGDAVFCFDKNCDFAYEERKVRIERVKKDNAYKSDVNPEGIVLVGRDITIDEDGKSIFMVTDDNFIRMAEFVDEKIWIMS